MSFAFVPVKGQKFDIGRTINPAKCDCVKCTFMNCPKNNYAVKMKKKVWKVADFWKEFKEDILAINKPSKWQYSFHNRYDLELNYKLLDEFMDMLFSFPKGTYWSPQDEKWHTDDTEIEEQIYKTVALQKVSRGGNIVELGSVSVGNGVCFDFDLSEAQERLAIKISNALKELKELVFEHYQENCKEWNIGWLSPEGRHYPCSHCEHLILAQHLGGGELFLETTGWIKVASCDEDGYFGNRRTMSAEQRNWLSLNGYYLED